MKRGRLAQVLGLVFLATLLTLGFITNQAMTLGCSRTVNLMYQLDRSGSMGTAFGSGTRLDALKGAVAHVTPQVSNPGSRQGVVSFADTPRVDLALTPVYTDVIAAVNALTANGGTEIVPAFVMAKNQLLGAEDPVVLLVTDAEITITQTNQLVSAIEVAQADPQLAGLRVFAIGVDLDSTREGYLAEIAEAGDGSWGNASSPDELDQLVQEMISVICNYQLTTNVVGQGTVTKNPDQTSYQAGTVVTLTASPSITSTFVNWTGAITGTANPTTVMMTANKVVTAMFTIKTAAIAITIEPENKTVCYNRSATFTIAVTNTGDLDLSNVTVTGTVGTCSRSIGTLVVGASNGYICTTNVTASFTNTVTSTGRANGQNVSAMDAAQVRMDACRTYLPVIQRDFLYAPDLVVVSGTIRNNYAMVIIANIGTAPTTGSWWIDGYVNPPRVPGPGDFWQDLSPGWDGSRWTGRGVAFSNWWPNGTTVSLKPGETITCSTVASESQGCNYWVYYSNVDPNLSGIGYYRVDTDDRVNWYNGELERHEILGQQENNLYGPFTIQATGVTASAAVTPTVPGPTQPMPVRPAAPGH